MTREFLEGDFQLRVTFDGWSMKYSIPPGSEIVIAAAKDFRPGTILVYQEDDRFIAHRLVKIQSPAAGGQCVFRAEPAGSPLELIPAERVLGTVVTVMQGDRRRALDTRWHRSLSSLWLHAPLIARIIYALRSRCRRGLKPRPPGYAPPRDTSR